jgi:hypothetical protein
MLQIALASARFLLLAHIDLSGCLDSVSIVLTNRFSSLVSLKSTFANSCLLIETFTPDHKNPHSINPDTDPKDVNQWQALCGRHQVMKKNYWDANTGKMNVYAIIQASTNSEKEIMFKFL